MSNATYRSGALTFEIAQDLEKFTLVTVNEANKIAPATADGPVFGAITEPGATDARDEGNDVLAVSYGQNVVKVRTDEDIAAGVAVYAAADGKAAAAGTVYVGTAYSDGGAVATKNGVVLVVLNGCPTRPDAV